MKYFQVAREWWLRDMLPKLTRLGTTGVLVTATLLSVISFAVPSFISVPLWLVAATRYFSLKYGLTSLWNPAVLVFWIGLVPNAAALLFFKRFPFAFPYEQYFLTPIWLIGLTALVWGIHMASGARVIVAERALLSPRNSTSKEKLELLSIILLLISLICYVVLFIANGNTYASTNPEEARTEIVAGSGMIGTLGLTALAVGLVLYVSGRHVKKVHLLAVPMGSVSLVLLAMTGTRAILLRMLIIIAVIVCIRIYGRIPAALLAGGAALGTIALGALGAIRFRGSDVGIFDSVLSRLSAEPHVSGMIIEYARSEGFWFGRAASSAFSIYLPGQAPLPGDVLKEELGAEFSGGGLSTPLPAEGFLEFGWVGVVAYGLLAGMLVGLVCKLLSSERIRQEAVLVMCMPLGIALSGIVGGLGTTLAVYLLPQLAICVATLAANRAIPERAVRAWSQRIV